MGTNFDKIKNILRLVASDFVTVSVALFLSVLITEQKVILTREVIVWMVFNCIAIFVAFSLFRQYAIVFSSVSVIDALKLGIACLMVFLLNIIYIYFMKSNFITIATALIFCGIELYCATFIRFSKRIFKTVIYNVKEKNYAKKRVMIVGAGRAGTALIREIEGSKHISYNPVCFIDEDMAKLGKEICGVKVVGRSADIPQMAEKYNVDEIFVALPSVERKEVKKVLEICRETGLNVMTLPGMYQLVNGQVTVSKLRNVDICDLLGRGQVTINTEEILSFIENKIVMVTGGGGSIGSELCRQIAAHNPKLLIILDIYENNAYDIEQELKRKFPFLNVLALIASIRDKGKIEDVFKTYRPQVVFNAAAHKHVPLMESSPNEAVKNNVFGTLNMATMADKYETETFVQISTDKAVNPTNIMGATKRICEMIIQTIGRKSKKTKFVAVRFGNVLGSNGSVIPLFRKQIEEGGPVTVTNKEIIRYFMTISEAVSLVLQAGYYAKDGQIFVLDMGEPVKIYDLAYNMIKLSGLEPNVDIDIVFTGLRPGEKLFEERLMSQEGMQKTPNGLISIANPIPIDEQYLWETLDKFYKAAYSETDKMKELVAELVTTYTIDTREDENGKVKTDFLEETKKDEMENCAVATSENGKINEEKIAVNE